VKISVQGGGYLTATSNSAGGGSGSFTDNDPPGTYTLVAEDNYGHKATAQFTVTAAPAAGTANIGQPTASPSVVDPGGVVTISVPITSNYSATTIFALTFEIKQAGTAWAAGPTITKVGKGVSLKPGETQNVQVQYTASDTGGPTANNIAMRHVGVEVRVAGERIRTNYIDNPHEFDDVFGVRVAPTPAPAAAAPKLDATNSPDQGTALHFTWSGFQPNQAIRIYVQGGGGANFTSNASGSGAGTFVVTESPGTYTLVAADMYGHKATDTFTVRTPVTPVVTAKVTAPAAPAAQAVPPVTPVAAPSLAAASSVQKGSSLSYSWAGFQPNASVRIYVQGGGGLTATSNSAGGGSGSFTDNDPPGTYTLVAEDNYGHKATTQFKVTATTAAAAPTPTPTPTASVLTAASSVKRGSALTYTWWGFAPNSPIRIYVQGGGGLTATTGASGGGSGSFIDNDPPGTYTLVAEDYYGHKATTSFKVT
jgi:hypothetical protein